MSEGTPGRSPLPTADQLAQMIWRAYDDGKADSSGRLRPLWHTIGEPAAAILRAGAAMLLLLEEERRGGAPASLEEIERLRADLKQEREWAEQGSARWYKDVERLEAELRVARAALVKLAMKLAEKKEA